MQVLRVNFEAVRETISRQATHRLFPFVALLVFVIGSCDSGDTNSVWIMVTKGSATRVVAENPDAQSSDGGEWVRVYVGQRSFDVAETYTAIDLGEKLSGKVSVNWHIEDPASFAEASLTISKFERDYLKPLVSLALYDSLLELETRILSRGPVESPAQAIEFLEEKLREEIQDEEVFDESATAYFGFVLDSIEINFDRGELP